MIIVENRINCLLPLLNIESFSLKFQEWSFSSYMYIKSHIDGQSNCLNFQHLVIIVALKDVYFRLLFGPFHTNQVEMIRMK